MTIGEFIEKYMRLNNDCLQNSDQIAYVAQYNLFDQVTWRIYNIDTRQAKIRHIIQPAE